MLPHRLISFPSPTHSFIPRLKPSFSANPSHRSLSFSSSGLTTWIPQTFTVTSKHIRFYFLVFRFTHFSCRFMCSTLMVKAKVFPYSLPSVGPRADPGVQAASQQVTWSESRHRPGSKKVKVAHTRLPSVWFRSWSRFLAVSPQVTWIVNPTAGCHY